MAQFVGSPVVVGDTDDIHTSEVTKLLTRAKDASRNEYIFLKGVTSTAAGSSVTFDEAGSTTLLAANAVGPVAVAQAAVDANTKYGWYMIWGSCSAACDAGVVDNAALYIDGTSGRVDDTVVAGDKISGMVARSTDSGNFCTVQLNYPYVTDSLG